MPKFTTQAVEGFELVDVVPEDDIEQAEEATEFTLMTASSTSSPTEDFRLNPTQLNNLNLSYLARFAAKKHYHINDGFVDTGDLKIRTHFKHLAKDHELDFIVFQAVCDVARPNELKINDLAYINDVIRSFKEKYPELEGKLLIPLNQSRVGKRHSVLVEVRMLEKQIKEVILHNSQSKWGNLIYPNCLNDLNAVCINSKHYQMQKDDISCGFFVHFYIESILENKESSQLKNIYVTLQTLVSNPTLLEDTLNKNFVEKYPDARKITASGEALSWEKAALETELDEEEYQKTKARDIEFPEGFEDSAVEKRDQKMIYSR
ncbi:hypothetical protein [Rickettsiella endosymbiont of Aleochara curtula]|uniref:hypothetical protein n=1 Tax=Rickettsiella endosymbiont of Aleochara curtula TaxID=3077936 RepID=UPI00313CC7D5